MAIAEEQAVAHEAEEEAVSGAEEASAATPAPESALLSLEEASARIDPATLEMLEEKFRGKLTGVRRLNERDALF